MGNRTNELAQLRRQVLHAAHTSFVTIPPNADNVREALQSGITDAHDGIRLTRYTSEQDPHSTACVLILQPGRADWAHCGDSRIYHFRSGTLISRSFDHSYVMDLVRRGLLSET